MQRFRISLLLILLFLFAVWIEPLDSVAGQWYGTFGTTDSPRDTVRICVSTFDTLAYSADPESLWMWRHYHGTLIDSISIGAGNLSTYRSANHLGEFCIPEQAYHRDFGKGIYDVTIRWKITTRTFSVSGSYEVRDELGYNQDVWAEIKRQSDGVRDPQEYHPGVQMHDFEDSTDWSVYGTGALMFNDEVNFVEGFQGVKLVSQDQNVARLEAEIGTQEYHIANFSFYAYVDPATRPYYGNNDSTSEFLSLKIMFGTGSVGAAWTVYMSYTFPDTHIVTGWNKFCIPADVFVATGGAAWDDTPMTRIGLEIDTRYADDSVAVTFDDQCRDRRAKATFMFRFDDADGTIYDSAFYTLEQYNFLAHVCLMTNQVGSKGAAYAAGYSMKLAAGEKEVPLRSPSALTLAQLEEMYDNDWDICSHGDDGHGLEGDARTTQWQTLMRAQRWLMQNGFSRSAGYHGWGYDEYDSISINIVRENFEFASGGRSSLFHDHIDFTDSLLDRRYTAPIKVMYTWGPITDTTGAAEVIAWIDSTIKNGGLLIMVFHSFTGIHGGGSCHVDTLIEICDYLYEHKGLIDVVTPTEYIDVVYRDPYEAVVRAKEIKVIADSTLERLIAFKDSVENAVIDANKANFHSSGDTIQREASVAGDEMGLIDSAITEDKIKSFALRNNQLAAGFLSAAKIADQAFTNAKFGFNFLTKDRISSQAIGWDEMHESWRDSTYGIVRAILDSIQVHAPHGDNWASAILAEDAIAAPVFADNAQYMIYGGAIWVDTINGTAGAVVGVNGLPSLPCRGFVNAKTIADAIGVRVFYVLGGGDQSIKETMNGYGFIGMGDPTRNKIDLNSQDVSGCMFTDLDITGIQGGDRAAYVRCALEGASIDAAALQCGLRGDITLLGDRDNVFVGCASSVPGGLTPSLIFSGGSESVQFRGYSGGIHLFGMGANDSLSFEAIGGQLQIGAGVNVNAKITARGMITLTDSTAGLNNLTYVATAQYAVDSTMNAITDANKANFKATDLSAQIDSILYSISFTSGLTDSVGTTTLARDSTNFVAVADDFYNGVFLKFISGQNAGLVRLIEDFGNYGEFTLYPALPNAVASGEYFRILDHVIGEKDEGGIVRIYKR